MNTRISTTISASLTLLAVVAAATAKGYVSTLGELSFVVAVTAVGLVVARFWSQTLARRIVGRVDRGTLTQELSTASMALLPSIVLLAVAAVAWLITGSIDVAVTAAMIGLTLALFAYTWVGTHAVLWSLGTAVVATLMTLFKVVV